MDLDLHAALTDVPADGLLGDWEPFVVSHAALRIAQACIDFGVPWPQFSEDTLIQFLVIEAIAGRLHHERAAEQKAAEASAEASRAAQQALKDWK